MSLRLSKIFPFVSIHEHKRIYSRANMKNAQETVHNEKCYRLYYMCALQTDSFYVARAIPSNSHKTSFFFSLFDFGVVASGLGCLMGFWVCQVILSIPLVCAPPLFLPARRDDVSRSRVTIFLFCMLYLLVFFYFFFFSLSLLLLYNIMFFFLPCFLYMLVLFLKYILRITGLRERGEGEPEVCQMQQVKAEVKH